MNINNFSEERNVLNQRENLLSENKGIFHGVYEILEDSSENIIIKNITEVLACDPKKFDKVKGLIKNKDIKIINLLELKKGNIKFLNKKFHINKYKKRNLKLLENGIIELNKINNSGKKDFFTTKFQISSNDYIKKENGKNISNNLRDEQEKQNYDNSPFIGKKEDGKYYLFIEKGENDFNEKLKLLKRYFDFTTYGKRLDRNNSKNLEIIKKFENSTDIKYEELYCILDEIIRKGRIDFYEVIDETKEYKDETKKIKIIDENGKKKQIGDFLVFNNIKNNSIEYRSIKKIIFPEKTNILGRISLDFDKDQNKIIKENKNETLKQNKIKILINSILNKVKKIIR